MKRYYERMGNFSNVYDLAWADNTEDCKALEGLGFERVSRKTAIHECKAEEYRRENDQAFSGYADAYIYPAYVYTAQGTAEDEYERRDEAETIHYMRDPHKGDARYIIEGERK